MSVNIQLPHDEIQAFCRRHHIQRMQLFGSALLDSFRPGSDIDILVEFEPGKNPGWEFFSMAGELSLILGYPVDMTTPGGLSRHIRDDVLSSAVVIYDHAA